MREKSKGHWRGILGMDAKGTGVTLQGCAGSIWCQHPPMWIVHIPFWRGDGWLSRGPSSWQRTSQSGGALKDRVNYPPPSLHLSSPYRNPLQGHCTFSSIHQDSSSKEGPGERSEPKWTPAYATLLPDVVSTSDWYTWTESYNTPEISLLHFTVQLKNHS